MDSDSILQGSIQSASYNIILQISFRIITFLLNGFILHYVTQDVLGIINVRLMLLFSTVMFVSREAFRRACLTKTTQHNWPQVINLLWLTVPNTILWATFFGYIWTYQLEVPPSPYASSYYFAVFIIALSCVIESFAEPIYLFSQAFLYVRWRLFMDCVMMAIKTFSLAFTVAWVPKYAIESFAVGQLVASISFVICYALYFQLQFLEKSQLVKDRELHKDNPLLQLPFDSMTDFLPRTLDAQPIIGFDLAYLTFSFFKQGILKQILTEGERYIMTIFSVLSFAEQGVYDVVNNLGSMAARYIFLPIEESGYFYFAQMLHRNLPLEEQPEDDVKRASVVLRHLLRTMSLLGCTILVFGMSYSNLLLWLYGGPTLASGVGPLLMRAHCACVPLLAINGITEAYVFAAMSHSQLDRYNHFMVVLSVLFLGLSWGLSKTLGSVGFIVANCCNMAMRIAHSLWFIEGHYKRIQQHFPLSGLVPSRVESVAFFLAFLITQTSEQFVYPLSAVLHVLIGASCGIAVVSAILKTEPDLLVFLVKMVKQKFGRSD